MDELIKYEILKSNKLRIVIDLNPMHEYSMNISEFTDDWSVHLTLYLASDFKLKGFGRVIFHNLKTEDISLSNEDKLDLLDLICNRYINHKEWFFVIDNIFSFEDEQEPRVDDIINKMKLATYFREDDT